MAKAIDASNMQLKKDSAKVKDIQDLWMRFSARLEYRLKLGKMYFDFHRHRQLVGALYSKMIVEQIKRFNVSFKFPDQLFAFLIAVWEIGRALQSADK